MQHPTIQFVPKLQKGIRNGITVFKIFIWEGILYSYFMPVCSIVRLSPLGAVDNQMHYCTQPTASCNSASGRLHHLGLTVLTILQTGMK